MGGWGRGGRVLLKAIQSKRHNNFLFASTTATLLKNPPSDCQNIVDDYSNGKLLMYEYKIQMARCMKKSKDDAGKSYWLESWWFTIEGLTGNVRVNWQVKSAKGYKGEESRVKRVKIQWTYKVAAGKEIDWVEHSFQCNIQSKSTLTSQKYTHTWSSVLVCCVSSSITNFEEWAVGCDFRSLALVARSSENIQVTLKFVKRSLPIRKQCPGKEHFTTLDLRIPRCMLIYSVQS